MASQPLRGTWLADPLVLDSAFQAMIVWSFENHGCGSLPAHAGQYRQYVRSFPRDGVRICAEVTQSNAQRAVADVWFLDRSGAVVAHMKDYECVIDASLNQAFRRNQLAAEVVSRLPPIELEDSVGGPLLGAAGATGKSCRATTCTIATRITSS